MIKRITLLLAMAAAIAAAQTATFTAPPGAISCSYPKPYTQFYQYLVENSTPPYPNGITVNGRTFFASPLPNHPYPVANGNCGYMAGFVSASGLYIGTLQVSQFRTSAPQDIFLGSITWTVPDPNTAYPAEGQPATFAMDADITQVCGVICGGASGTFHMEGHWAFQWQTRVVRGCRTCGSWTYVEKVWTNTSPVVITIND